MVVVSGIERVNLQFEQGIIGIIVKLVGFCSAYQSSD